MFRKILSSNLPKNIRKCKFVSIIEPRLSIKVNNDLDSGYQLPQNIEEISQSQTREVASSQAARYKYTMISYLSLTNNKLINNPYQNPYTTYTKPNVSS